MILKSIKLENIRSYVNETIEFPEGSVLLAGDIGSGKSTVLQAIEFALFGIKSEMPGSSLLRHGKPKGSVELKFSLDGKDIIIKRALKRGKKSIAQEAGYIITNGLKKEGTATELKSAVFELLGYPKGLVSKSRDLIYRYTVYTMQEEMKAILTEDREYRLDTLRRVFDIDKYKRIRENSSLLTRELKAEIKRGGGITEDLEEKKKERELQAKEKKELKEKLEKVLPDLKVKKENLEKKKKEIEKIEKGIETLSSLKNELKISENNLINQLEQRNKNKTKIETIEKEISQLEKDESIKLEIKIEEIKKGIDERKDSIDSTERKTRELSFKISEIKVKTKSSEETKSKISALSICPVCKQEVSEQHKHSILTGEDEKIGNLKKELVIYDEQEKKETEMLQKSKKELDALREKERSFDLINLKLINLKEKINLKNKLILEQDTIKKEIGNINSKKIELNKQTAAFENIEGIYKKLKEGLEQLQSEERELEIKKVSLEKEIAGIDRLILNLDAEISKKTKVKGKVGELKETENWVNKLFINLISSMEKQVMLKLHYGFNELFQDWFNILIEDDRINVRLDDEFTPVIEQNGYETWIENLSGGEKTALALAYRLSLNKVINDFIETIKTKDIIILDEPTDGFSTEQLDKIKDVLEQLNIKQVIIVSHETKIESFVENIVRIQKEEHISRVVA